MIEQVHPRDLASWIRTLSAQGPAPLVLDVREPHEWQMASVKADGFELQAIPMRAVPVRMNELDAALSYRKQRDLFDPLECRISFHQDVL